MAALLLVFFRILRPRRYNSGINPSTLNARKMRDMKDFQRVRESRIGEEEVGGRCLLNGGSVLHMASEHGIRIHSYMKWGMMM